MALAGAMNAQAMVVSFTGTPGTYNSSTGLVTGFDDPVQSDLSLYKSAWEADPAHTLVGNYLDNDWGDPYGGNRPFNPANDSSPDGNTYAVAFSFTVLTGISEPIINPITSCSVAAFPTEFQVTDFCVSKNGGTLFTALIPTIDPAGNEIVFNAPAGFQLDKGDRYYMNVAFAGTAADFDTQDFSFEGEWSVCPFRFRLFRSLPRSRFLPSL
ncbi:MAG: hypothetical protein ACRELF_19180 [Gemmataceae bacterium]